MVTIKYLGKKSKKKKKIQWQKQNKRKLEDRRDKNKRLSVNLDDYDGLSLQNLKARIEL